MKARFTIHFPKLGAGRRQKQGSKRGWKKASLRVESAATFSLSLPARAMSIGRA